MFDKSSHEVFSDQPVAEQRLIRYLSLPKYLDLLTTSCLNFSAPSSLSDPWEGEVSDVNRKLRPKIYSDLRPEVLVQMAEVDRSAKDFAYVSCWHEYDRESSLMWKVYAMELGSVAITTTWENLTNSITDDLNVYGGRVRYVDHSATFIPENNLFWRHMHKGHQYKEENEVRLAVARDIHSQPDSLKFLKVKVDVNCLVGQVVLSPGTPPWIRDLLRALSSNYGLSSQVIQSTLDL